MDKFPLCLSHIAQKLEHNVRDQRTGQVPALPGVQQGHIQHDDGRSLGLCDEAPLLQDLLVVPPQPVNALDHQHVPGLEHLDQLLVQRPVKALARLLFYCDPLQAHTKFLERRHLTVLLLASGGYAGIAVHHI